MFKEIKMDEYKLVHNMDGNEELEVGECKNEHGAYVEALKVLGWSLVKVESED